MFRLLFILYLWTSLAASGFVLAQAFGHSHDIKRYRAALEQETTHLEGQRQQINAMLEARDKRAQAAMTHLEQQITELQKKEAALTGLARKPERDIKLAGVCFGLHAILMLVYCLVRRIRHYGYDEIVDLSRSPNA